MEVCRNNMKGGSVQIPPGNIAHAGSISNILKNVVCGKGLSDKVIYCVADK